MPKQVVSINKLHDVLYHARDGEVVLYRRSNSGRWQARFKVDDARWLRVTTKKRAVEDAARVACEKYDRARFLREQGLPVVSKRFAAAARAAIDQMRDAMDAGQGRSVYESYISALTHYLIPFFGNHDVHRIDQKTIKAFETWRKQKLGKEPAASSITTHNSALNRVFDLALEHGWVSKLQIPALSNKGAKAKARPNFSQDEYKQLTAYMVNWAKEGHTEKTRMMRELLRDYVLILANTGIRHGTEALNLKWKNVEWVRKGNERYLLFAVSGKTGSRSLIARPNTETYLRRIQQRFGELAKLDFDQLLKKRIDEYVFRLRDGTRSGSLNGTFRVLMQDSGLEKCPRTGLNRTLYSLRHMYAHFALLQDRMDVYTLAKQMGTSVKMIELHYGGITPAMKADKIAGPSFPKKKVSTKAPAAARANRA